MGGALSARLEEIAGSCPGVSWGMAIRSAPTGEVLAQQRADDVLSTASVGKVVLLLAAARLMDTGRLPPDEPLDRRGVPPVADSGLWRHLAVDVLPADDACVLVGAVSDNLATNVLLRRIGPDSLRATAAALGLRSTALHDEVRDVRGPGVPERLSSGTAAELSQLFAALHVDTALPASVSARVRGWLALDVDLSMAAGAFGLDPLVAHDGGDRGLALAHKTGADDGVRADGGLLMGERTAVAYAVLANWPPAEDRRDEVHAAMRRFGAQLRALVPPR